MSVCAPSRTDRREPPACTYPTTHGRVPGSRPQSVRLSTRRHAMRLGAAMMATSSEHWRMFEAETGHACARPRYSARGRRRVCQPRAVTDPPPRGSRRGLRPRVGSIVDGDKPSKYCRSRGLGMQAPPCMDVDPAQRMRASSSMARAGCGTDVLDGETCGTLFWAR